MSLYRVTYFYHNEMMEEPDQRDYGTVAVGTPEEAVEMILKVNFEGTPEGEVQTIRDRLTATLVE